MHIEYDSKHNSSEAFLVMTVPRKITIRTTQEESLTLTSRKEHCRTHYPWVQYIILDREVLTPPPCE